MSHQLQKMLKRMLLFLSNSSVEFVLIIASPCDPIDSFQEGAEFSIRFDTGPRWLPIVFLVNKLKRSFYPSSHIFIGDPDNLVIRGYTVNVEDISLTPYSVQICDFDEQITSIQLRWLQTSNFDGESNDFWVIDDVNVSYESNYRIELLRDSFEEAQLK